MTPTVTACRPPVADAEPSGEAPEALAHATRSTDASAADRMSGIFRRTGFSFELAWGCGTPAMERPGTRADRERCPTLRTWSTPQALRMGQNCTSPARMSRKNGIGDCDPRLTGPGSVVDRSLSNPTSIVFDGAEK